MKSSGKQFLGKLLLNPLCSLRAKISRTSGTGSAYGNTEIDIETKF